MRCFICDNLVYKTTGNHGKYKKEPKYRHKHINVEQDVPIHIFCSNDCKMTFLHQIKNKKRGKKKHGK